MLNRGFGLARWQAAVFALLILWALWPVAMAVVHVTVHGGALTGAVGGDFTDQFQYLAWIRDEGQHVFASNLWTIGPSPHDYLQPMYAVSGALWQLGLSIQLAYLIWIPVAIVVLFLGSAAYVRRMLAGRWAPMVALLLVLFYHSPVYALTRWFWHLSTAHQFQLLRVTTDADSSLQLWGFAHTAIAIGLMPVFLLSIERQLRSTDARSSRRWGTLAGAAGLLTSWLHPWQGAILLLVLAGLIAARARRRRYLVLFVPAAATVLPLLYTEILAHEDSSWHRFQSLLAANTIAPAWALAAAFAPLAIVALLGVRRPRDDGEWMLVLWPVATVAVYLLGPNTSPHAWSSITIPLAVLAVRGWDRALAWLRVPARLGATLATLAVLAFTIPAAVVEAQDAHAVVTPSLSGRLGLQQLRLTADQAQAVAYLDHSSRAGGVLAPWLLSLTIPALTDRQVFSGHQWWSPPQNLAEVTAFFNPAATGAAAAQMRRRIVLGSRAAYVLADCGAPAGLVADLRPVANPVRQFGCVTVYETSSAVPR